MRRTTDVERLFRLENAKRRKADGERGCYAQCSHGGECMLQSQHAGQCDSGFCLWGPK